MSRKGRGSKKGGAFERQVCRLLSIWWSQGKRDDLYWRSAGSGARATRRSKQGKRTAGNYGDITACHPRAEPLLRAFTIEIKRGYSKHTFQDLLDTSGISIPEIESWIDQAMRGQCESGSKSWLIILQRDRRRSLVCLPAPAYEALQISCNHWMRIALRKQELVVIRFADFLLLDPRLVKEYGSNKATE